MSFKDKLGKILSGVEGTLTAINPIAGLVGGVIKSIIPGNKEDKAVDAIVDTFLPQASTLVLNIDAFAQALALAGPQKLVAAQGPMTQLLLTSSSFAGKKIADPERFKKGAASIASGLADCWGAVDESEVVAVPVTK